MEDEEKACVCGSSLRGEEEKESLEALKLKLDHEFRMASLELEKEKVRHTNKMEEIRLLQELNMAKKKGDTHIELNTIEDGMVEEGLS